MRALTAIGIVAGVAGVAYASRSRATSSSSSTAGASLQRAVLEEVLVTARRIVGGSWALPASAEPYRLTIAAAEGRHAIPRGLLGRLLYQESRFRADIISGAVVSDAGAVGIAQIVPRWHPSVDPLDPIASINYAANYLASLRAKFASWELALAAYNWGQGNLRTHLASIPAGGDWLTAAWIDSNGLRHSVPLETRNYVTQITADVPVSGVPA